MAFDANCGDFPEYDTSNKELMELFVKQALTTTIAAVRKLKCFSPFAIVFVTKDLEGNVRAPASVAVSAEIVLDTVQDEEEKARLRAAFPNDFELCRDAVTKMAKRFSASALLFFASGDIADDADQRRAGILASFHHHKFPRRAWFADIADESRIADFEPVELDAQADPATGLLPLWN